MQVWLRRLKELTQKILEIHGSVVPHPESKEYSNNTCRKQDLNELNNILQELYDLRGKLDEKKPIDKRILAVTFLISKSFNDHIRLSVPAKVDAKLKNGEEAKEADEQKASNAIDQLYAESSAKRYRI